MLIYSFGTVDQKLVKKSTHDLFVGKDILLVSVCGAFTPTVKKMVKDFEKLYDT